MQIKIYFSDLKPEKQRELLPKLREFFDEEIPIPLVIFDTDYEGQEADDRMEQDAQIASEEQVLEPEKKDKEYPF